MNQKYEYELTQEQIAVTVAHEIKNPLALIKATLQYLELGDTERTYRQKYEIIYREIDRLSELVANYMETSGYKKLCKKNFTIYGLMDELEQIFRETVKAREIKLSILKPDKTMEIEGDFNKIKQVLINLITNSIEALEEKDDGEIRVFTCIEKDCLVITVSDNGCGIKEASSHLIGSPFFTTKDKGTGLGLSISKEIVKMHGGVLTIKGTEGEGTVVTVKLPAHDRL